MFFNYWLCLWFAAQMNKRNNWAREQVIQHRISHTSIILISPSWYFMYSKYLSSYTRPSYTAPKVYPQDIECIIQPIENKGGVYVSNIEAAQNINTLKRYNIKAILSAAHGVHHSHPKEEIHSIKYVPAEDHESYDISKYFDDSVQWISQNLKTSNILVHCMAGVSRSVSLLLAYLIKHKNMRYHDAYDFVKSKRRIIHPNSGFVRQLKDYEQKQVRRLERERTPSPKPRGLSPVTEAKTAATPNLLRYTTDYRPSSEYRSSVPYSASKNYKNGVSQRQTSPPRKLTETDLDQRIEEIRRKYANKSEYIPSKHIRQHSSYKQTRTNQPIFERNYRPSRYMGHDYKSGLTFYDRLKNPEVYGGGRLYNNFLYSGGY